MDIREKVARALIATKHGQHMLDEMTKLNPHYLAMADAALEASGYHRMREALEWRPIETAPKNKPILVWHPGFGMGGWNVMAFDGTEWRETANDGRALKEGYEPSHWLPLPSPPAPPDPHGLVGVLPNRRV